MRPLRPLSPAPAPTSGVGRWLRPVLIGLSGLLLASCASSAKVNRLEETVHKLTREVRLARQGAALAEAKLRELDLRTEVHAYLQRDRMLAQEGHFPALERRVGLASRSFRFLLPSDLGEGAARALYFKPDSYLRIDFVAGLSDPDGEGHELTVSSRSQSFKPVGKEPDPSGSYTFSEKESLLVQTGTPIYEGPRGGDSDVSELLFRFTPAQGPSPVRHAYVRVTFVYSPGDAAAVKPTGLPRVRSDKAATPVIEAEVPEATGSADSTPAEGGAAPPAGPAPTEDRPLDAPPGGGEAMDLEDLLETP